MKAVKVVRARVHNENCATCKFADCNFYVDTIGMNDMPDRKYYCRYDVPDSNDTTFYFQIHRQVYVTTVCEHFDSRISLVKTRSPRQVRFI